NLKYWVDRDPDIKPTWIPILFDAPDRWRRMPVVRGNWTLRASLRARQQLRELLRFEQLDGLFFHTQVTALFAQRLKTRIPTVVSLDATPLNFDAIGAAYHHTPSNLRHVEAVKNALNRRTFNLAHTLITWNDWSKQSLVRDYRIDPDKVEVVPPGIDTERWHFPRPPGPSGPVRLLFVGGDFL